MNILKKIFEKTTKVNLTLIFSIGANIFLVWLGILTLEKSLRPIVFFDDLTPQGIYFKNSGQSPAYLEIEIYGLNVATLDDANLSIKKYFSDKSVRKTLYPEQRILNMLPFLDSLMKDSTDYAHILKVRWKYPPLLWKVVPGISAYSDSIYWINDKPYKRWISIGEFHQSGDIDKIERSLKIFNR